jgi:hypothetical protein
MRKILLLLSASAFVLGMALITGCEGPMGPAGKDGVDGADGADGADGVDANETCKLCHNPASVDLISAQFEFSKHGYGEAAFEEAGNTGCDPCHESEAFKDVVARAVPSTITGGVNNYACSASTAYGEITCSTCHSSIHTTYGASDIPAFTTTAPVSMTMWGGTKEINLSQGDGSSNLCVKCHQPRPFTKSNLASTSRNMLDYDSLVAYPDLTFYNSARADGLTNVLKPGYRTHTHYGTVGAIFAGVGGIEFAGTQEYTSSDHTTMAACSDCHMAAMNGKAGGHTFTAKGNFNGCNVGGCHTTMSATAGAFTADQAEIKGYLNTLAGLLAEGGLEILNKNPDATTNLWAGLTTNKYDGYLNVYDPINNPNGLTNNGNCFKNEGSTNGWSAGQIATNNGLPKLTLTNGQMGAIINFQLCLREYSLGVHNFQYSKALLSNSIDLLSSK